MNIPDDELTLIPKENWRGSNFVKFTPSITITANDGKTNRFDQCANKVQSETAKIAKLAPKPPGSLILFTVCVFVLSLIAFGALGYWLGAR